MRLLELIKYNIIFVWHITDDTKKEQKREIIMVYSSYSQHTLLYFHHASYCSIIVELPNEGIHI